MKKIAIILIAMLGFGTASAQVNKMDPPTTAIPSPGTPPIKNATQEINRQHARKAQPTSLVTRPPVVNSGTGITQPVQRESKGNTTMEPYPGRKLAYPEPQGALQPGTATTTAPVSGTNNPTTTLPASNTTNQGKLP